MLELAEKIVSWVCLALVLVTGGWYFFAGTPSTTPSQFVPGVKEVTPRVPTNGKKGAEEPPPADEKTLVDELAKQGRKVLPGQRLQRKQNEVPEKLFEEISTEANWMRELNKAASDSLSVNGKATRKKIYNIDPDSLFAKLGFKENDVVELVDGQILEFDEGRTTEFFSKWKGALQKLRSGQSVSVTVTRNNQPLHLEFKL